MTTGTEPTLTTDAMTDDKVIKDICSHLVHRNAGTWRCGAVCRTCGWSGTFELTKGHDLDTGKTCPNCGNSYCLLSKGDEKYRKPTL